MNEDETMEPGDEAEKKSSSLILVIFVRHSFTGT